MKKEDLIKRNGYFGEYVEKCDECGNEVSLISQSYSTCSEYEVEVFIECKCGNHVKFNVSVN